MAKTRKVKDAKDLYTDELIYFTGHAKATYMSDGSTVEDSISNIKHLIELTYSELKELRTNSKLIPGCKYRITDFVTTTNGKESSSSAGHQFDIVVTALAVNTLDENAKVLPHDGDTYFSNNALSTWDIKYILDNNESRFNWANSTGKGVIYYMKDEYGNVASYDFKNIKFNGKYTFSYTVNNTLYDGSVKYGKVCYNNFICGDLLSYASYKGLPKVYFDNTSETSKCYNNVVLENCWDITFGNNCYNNKINSECESLRIGNDCHSNEFGVLCKSVNIDNKSNITIELDTNGNIIQYYNGDILNKQDKLVSGENIKTVNGKSILGEGNIDLNNLIEVTYEELVELRNNGALIPGKNYRIIDYVTTTNGIEYSSSAGYKFDLILTAVNNNSLSEKAYACHPKIIENNYVYDVTSPYLGYTISAANWSNVSIDNIPSGITDLGFAAADNDDVRQVTIQQYKQNNITCSEGSIKVIWKWQNGSGSKKINILGAELIRTSDNVVVSSDFHIGSTGTYDNNNVYTLVAPESDVYKFKFYIDGKTETVDSSCTIYAYKVYDYFKDTDINAWQIMYTLDNDKSRFRWADPTNGKGVIYYMKDEYCNEATYDFKNIKYNGYYTFSYIINEHIIDGSIKYGNRCHHNKICADMIVNGYKGLSKIYFKNTAATSECNNNIINNNCWDINFGDNCYGNKIGIGCEKIYFGNQCQLNIINNYCNNISLGNHITNVNFGNNCKACKISSSAEGTTLLDTCRYISIGNNCSINLYCSESTSFDNDVWLQNINIAGGISGQIEIDNINSTRILFVTKNANNEIYQYFESDIIDNLGKTDANVQAVDGDLIVDDIFVASGKQIVTITDDNIVLKPNKYYKKSNISSNIIIVTGNGDNNDIVQEYILEFTTADTGTTVTLPDSIKWLNGELPTFENACTYQLSIVNNLGVCAMFK